MITEPTVRAPYSVKSVAGYGRSAWQVLDANGYVIGRLVNRANAEEIARLLNVASENSGRITPDWCAKMAKLEIGHEVGAGLLAIDPLPEECPHAAPFRYCETCKVNPCPIGLGRGGG